MPSTQASTQASTQPLTIPPTTLSSQADQIPPFTVLQTELPTTSPTSSSTSSLPTPTPKRGRGRPRKILTPEEQAQLEYQQQHKRGRGRPRKVLSPEEQAKLEAELEYKKAHPKKRGRPKKEKPPETEPRVPKKRGRPRKEKPVDSSPKPPIPRKKPGPKKKAPLPENETSSSKSTKNRKKKVPLTPPDPYADDYFHFPSAVKGGVNKGKYFYPVAYILLRYLPFQSGNPIVLTSDQLLEALGFVNSDYSKGRNTNAGKETWIYNWFFQRVGIILIPVLKRQLEALTKLGVICYKKARKIYDGQGKSHLASQEEEEDIEEAELEALDDLGFESVSDVMMRNKSKTFYARSLERLKEFDPKYKDVERYYSCYAIWILKEYDPLTEEEYLKWKKRMNDLIIVKFRKYVNTFLENSSNKAAEAAVQGESVFCYHQSFAEKQNELAIRFLKI